MTTGCENCFLKTTNGCFSTISLDAALDVNKNKTIQKHKKGKVIFSEGNLSTGLYCIKSGKVKLTKTNQSGKESIVQLASPGNFIGHYNLFNGLNYFASAVALEEVEVCYLPKKFIMESICNHPSLNLQIINQLSRGMSDAEIKLNSVLKKNVRERLAHLFVTLYTTHGTTMEGRTRLDIKLSRDEIASMIGTVNETVTRFITEFKTEGLIEEENKYFFIIDQERLKEFANLDG